jgi:hypothetical protein
MATCGATSPPLRCRNWFFSTSLTHTPLGSAAPTRIGGLLRQYIPKGSTCRSTRKKSLMLSLTRSIPRYGKRSAGRRRRPPFEPEARKRCGGPCAGGPASANRRPYLAIVSAFSEMHFPTSLSTSTSVTSPTASTAFPISSTTLSGATPPLVNIIIIRPTSAGSVPSTSMIRARGVNRGRPRSRHSSLVAYV